MFGECACRQNCLTPTVALTYPNAHPYSLAVSNPDPEASNLGPKRGWATNLLFYPCFLRLLLCRSRRTNSHQPSNRYVDSILLNKEQHPPSLTNIVSRLNNFCPCILFRFCISRSLAPQVMYVFFFNFDRVLALPDQRS